MSDCGGSESAVADAHSIRLEAIEPAGGSVRLRRAARRWVVGRISAGPMLKGHRRLVTVDECQTSPRKSLATDAPEGARVIGRAGVLEAHQADARAGKERRGDMRLPSARRSPRVSYAALPKFVRQRFLPRRRQTPPPCRPPWLRQARFTASMQH